MIFDPRSGGLPLITLILCFSVVIVCSIGFLYAVGMFDSRISKVQNDSVNLTGINYNGETFNATNQTLHVVAKTVIPNYAFLILIFLVIAVLTIAAVALRR